MIKHLTWRIGAVTVTRLQEIEQIIPYDPVTPFFPQATVEALAELPELKPDYVTDDGALRLSIHTLLVDAPGLRLVVDTCVGNDRPRAFITEEPLQTPFLENMESLGWSPDRVDAVICTHMHVDHVGWNTRLVDGLFIPTFPNARYYFGREEFEHFRKTETGEVAIIAADSINPVIEAGLARFVETNHRFSDEISLIPTPGHTPGHVSVAIESMGERALISGDFVHHPCQMARPGWMTPWEHDHEQSLETRLSLFSDLADSGDLLIGTHFAAPTAGHVERNGGAFRFTGWKSGS